MLKEIVVLLLPFIIVFSNAVPTRPTPTKSSAISTTPVPEATLTPFPNPFKSITSLAPAVTATSTPVTVNNAEEQEGKTMPDEMARMKISDADGKVEMRTTDAEAIENIMPFWWPLRFAIINSLNITVENCNRMNISMDYNELKNEATTCHKIWAETIKKKFEKLWDEDVPSSDPILDDENFVNSKNIVSNATNANSTLSVEEKILVTNDLLSPVCLTMSDMKECAKPKYTTLTKAKQCKADLWLDIDDYVNTIDQDLCRDNVSWFLDLADVGGLNCISLMMTGMLESCFREYGQIGINGSNDIELTETVNFHSEHGDAEPDLTFCKVIGIIGNCAWTYLMKQCSEDKPRQILQDTFKGTQNLWNQKCRGSLESTSSGCVNGWFWPGGVLGLLATMQIWNWIRNLS